MEHNQKPTQPTIESIMAVLDRVGERLDKAAERSKITDERLDRIAAEREKDAAEAAKRNAERNAEREKDAAEAAKRNAERNAEREKDAAEAKERYKKLDEEIEKVSKMVGGIANNNGFMAEDYFFNALSSSLHFGQNQYDVISKCDKRKKGKVEDEFDIIMYNGTSVALIEAKYRVHPNVVEQLTTHKVQNFRTLYPEFARHKVYLGIAGLSMDNVVIAEAKKHGIGVLQQKGDTIEYDTKNMKAY